MLTIASAMLYGRDLKTHHELDAPPGAVVQFGDMRATAKPWATNVKNTDPGAEWAAAERATGGVW